MSELLESHPSMVYNAEGLTNIETDIRMIRRFEHMLGLTSLYLEGAKQVLDVGCGIGAFSERLSNSGNFKTIGTDISPVKLQSNPIELKLVSDVRNLPFADKKFDMVFCMEVLEHISSWENALWELIRVGKTIIITTPYNEDILSVKCAHCEEMTPLWGHINVFGKESLDFLRKNFEVHVSYMGSMATFREYFFRGIKIILSRFKSELMPETDLDLQTACIHCGKLTEYSLLRRRMLKRIKIILTRKPTWIVYVIKK